MRGLQGVPPSTWATSPLGQVVEAIYGKALPEKARRSQGKWPVVGSSGVVGIHDEYLVGTPSLVIGRKGNVGAVHLMSGPSWPIDTTYHITPPSGIDIKYLAYLLGSLDLVGLDKSTAIPGLSRDDLYRVEIAIAPAAEQTRIVAKLDELLSDLDAGVAELKAAQKKLQQYRQSLLKAAVEGALTADWREAQRQQGTPTETGAQLLARILTERRARWEAKQLAKFDEQGKAPPNDWQKKYPEPERHDGAKLRSLPEGWVWTSVDQLSPDDLANGRSVPSAEGGAKVLRLTAVRNGLIDLNEVKGGEWTHDEAKPFAVEKGDLLIVRGNGSKSLVGRAGLVGPVNEQVAYPDTLIRLRVCEAVVSSRWVALVWDSEIVRSHLERRARTSAGIYKISQPDIVSVRIPVPPINEAVQAIERLESQLELVADLERTVGKLLRQSSGQRQNVLRCAFAGNLVPQDPNDEPVGVLLARICAERSEHANLTRSRKTKKYVEA